MPEINEDTPRIVRAEEVGLPLHLQRKLMLLARINFSAEICGLIDSRMALHPVSNVHLKPEKHFLMCSNEFRTVLERIVAGGDAVYGVYHTHPTGNLYPSGGDIRGWPVKELSWRYFIATKTEIGEFIYENQPDSVTVGG